MFLKLAKKVNKNFFLRSFLCTESERGKVEGFLLGISVGIFQVKDVTLKDNGAYKCVAYNVAGRDELLYTVSIVRKLYFFNFKFSISSFNNYLSFLKFKS